MALGSAITGIAGAALGGIGSAIGGSSASKAANKAADTQLAVAQQNNALIQSLYNQNQSNLSPFISSGTNAGNYLNAFLGIGGTTTAAPSTGGTSANWSAYLQNNPDILQGYYQTADQSRFSTPEAYAQWHYQQYGQKEGRSLPTSGGAVSPSGSVTQTDAKNAFASWLGNSDYAYQSALGENQVNSGFAGSGALQSGAALKALQTRQNNINQGYQGTWMNQLAGQQATGLGAASALAGVPTNYGAQVSANNQNAADASSNAALINGQNNPWANALSTIGGGLLGLGK